MAGNTDKVPELFRSSATKKEPSAWDSPGPAAFNFKSMCGGFFKRVKLVERVIEWPPLRFCYSYTTL